jgi:hypothetical protein
MYARSAAESVPHWRPATEEGLVVAVPESTQIGGDGEPAWADPEVTARDVLLAREEALSRHPDAAAATIIGGASQGGGRAAAIALTGDPFSCRGLVAVVSAYPDVPDVAVRRGMRVPAASARICSPAIETQRASKSSTFTRTSWGGVQTKQEVVPDLGHEFPDDFPQRLRCAVLFIHGN